jgi:hypothetical protein
MVMLSPRDQLEIKKELGEARMVYRETAIIIPTFTSGSNYEAFTDSPYEITGAEAGQGSVTYETHRVYARVKIVKDTTLVGLNQVYSGLEIGDYLLYFLDRDKPVLDKVVSNPDAYFVVDGIQLKPYNTTLNGVGLTADVFVHGKKFSPSYRKDGT